MEKIFQVEQSHLSNATNQTFDKIDNDKKDLVIFLGKFFERTQYKKNYYENFVRDCYGPYINHAYLYCT